MYTPTVNNSSLDMGQKWEVVTCALFFGGGELSPHITRHLGRDLPLYRTKWHIDASNRLATIGTNVTDRQDRTDNGPIAYGEQFLANVNSICYRPSVCRLSVCRQ